MSLSGIPFDEGDGALAFYDGASLIHNVYYEDGNFQFSGMKKGLREVIDHYHRNKYIGSRLGKETPIPFSFEANAVGFTDATEASLFDVLYRNGLWADAVSTLPASAGGGPDGVYCLKLVWTGARTLVGGTANSKITFHYCTTELNFGEGSNGKFSISGVAKPYGLTPIVIE